jgi:hypothetical protein
MVNAIKKAKTMDTLKLLISKTGRKRLINNPKGRMAMKPKVSERKTLLFS